MFLGHQPLAQHLKHFYSHCNMHPNIDRHSQYGRYTPAERRKFKPVQFPLFANWPLMPIDSYSRELAPAFPNINTGSNAQFNTQQYQPSSMVKSSPSVSTIASQQEITLTKLPSHTNAFSLSHIHMHWNKPQYTILSNNNNVKQQCSTYVIHLC